MTSLEESVRLSHKVPANALVSKGFGGSRPGLGRVSGRNSGRKIGVAENRGGLWSRMSGSEWRSVVPVTFPLGVRVGGSREAPSAASGWRLPVTAGDAGERGDHGGLPAVQRREADCRSGHPAAGHPARAP